MQFSVLHRWSVGRLPFILSLSIVAIVGILPARAQRPLGIDVSYWQGNLTQDRWNSAYASGRVFAFVRATHYSAPGEDDAQGSPDSRFVNNMNFAKTAGFLAGAYHYARPEIRTPQVEADFFLDIARPFCVPGYMRPMLDIESGGGAVVGASNLSDWCNAWINYVDQQTGTEAMIYTGHNYLSKFNSSISARTLFYARWSNPSNIQTAQPDMSWAPFSAWTFWQYSGGYVPGISDNTSDNIDLDVFNGTMAQLQNQMIVARGYITRSPASLSCTVRQRRSAPSQSFTVRNTGQGWMPYTSTATQWVTCSPLSGSCNSAANTVIVNFATAGLAPGTYDTIVAINAPMATNSPQSVAVSITVTPIPGDLNHDGTIEPHDANAFLACMTGPGGGVLQGCSEADLDADSDVDQSDFALMQQCYSGQGVPANPDCLP